MALFGTLVNGAFIVAGTCIGLIFTNIPERIKQTALQGIGLVVALIGLQMAIQAENIIMILLSILIGSMIGTAMQLENQLNRFGQKLESKVSKESKGNVTEGFVTATLIFVIGAMAIIGALDGGLRGDHEVLITKAFLDGFMAMVLASTLGYGVIFSVIPVVLYQGTIALLAVQINKWIPDQYLELFISEMTALGGLLILAIGLNILNLTKIKIGDFLPAVILFIIFFFGYHMLV
ncbi:hypothetical protein SAMN04487944_12037 [Gracilibacillus ureilyticus]|uniref:DUF554 domain-containing protein n=1 Tax=Gracilibacillus ureilyticus TaxID=531814 RepID=A0A1H9UZC3_9BACI|nr:DUF554 domain-containing protein [Gracilibacillus ureilyticus]SES14699.1 hypothetical protein SAMN04487944_12037 [Gracilibacillus ureilyticus]